MQISIQCLAGFLTLLCMFGASDCRDGGGEQSDLEPRIAVIGSGIAGSAASYFLRRSFPFAVIDVYEREQEVGGRIKSILFDGNVVEAGASVIHVSNKYMKEFVTQTGLPIRTKSVYGGKMGIFDGEKLCFTSTGWSWLDSLIMLWRYGFGLLRLNPLITDAVTKFTQVYSLQDSGQFYETPEELLRALQLYNLTQTTIGKHLQGAGVPERFIHEVAAAIGRVNYGQDTNALNALAGSISLSADSKSLWSVEGGNVRVCQALLKLVGARVYLGTAVSRVARAPGPLPAAYTLDFVGPDGGSSTSAAYDAVVLAAPLELAAIALDGLTPPGRDSASSAAAAAPPRRFWTTHATFVKGTLRPAAVGLKDSDTPPSIVLTAETGPTAFNSIGALSDCPAAAAAAGGGGGECAYKVFSREALDDAALDRLFAARGGRPAVRHPWAAYPAFAPPEAFPPFDLDAAAAGAAATPNALESMGSCMEVEAVAARNVALLIAHKLRARPPAAAAAAAAAAAPDEREAGAAAGGAAAGGGETVAAGGGTGGGGATEAEL